MTPTETDDQRVIGTAEVTDANALVNRRGVFVTLQTKYSFVCTMNLCSFKAEHKLYLVF